jgi:hypothetical protein
VELGKINLQSNHEMMIAKDFFCVLLNIKTKWQTEEGGILEDIKKEE